VRNDVLDRVTRADVVDDLLAWRLEERGFREKCRDEVTGDEFAGAVDEAVGSPSTRSRYPLFRDNALDDVLPVFLDGGLPRDSETFRYLRTASSGLTRQPVKAAVRRLGHALPASSTTLNG
jgi:hypothetical protein